MTPSVRQQKMNFEKNNLLQSLPLEAADLRIRKWVRDDVDRRADWPQYPKAYAAFNGNLHRLSQNERDEYFTTEKNQGQTRC